MSTNPPVVSAQTTENAPVLPSYKTNGVSMTARTTGTLQQRGSCLVVSHGSGADFDLLIFPEGSARWDIDSGSLVYRGISTKIGAAIDLGGGAIELEKNSTNIKNLPADCERQYVWLVG